MWADNEVSTRNCCNTGVMGKRVYCRKGHWLSQNKPRGSLTEEYVRWSPRLMPGCIDCEDFDNSWDLRKQINGRRNER